MVFLLAFAEVVRLHRARRYKGTRGMMRSGGDRPKLTSALRIEGDLQLILPSFAERKAQKKYGNGREDSAIQVWDDSKLVA